MGGRSPEGLLLVDKPSGPTSHRVVAVARRLLGTRKVGHGGTLDPLATGVLVLGIGKGTKLLTYVSGDDKEYEATIRLGVSTETDDSEGLWTSWSGASGIGVEAVRRAMAGLTGDIEQVPSSVSAIKVGGKRSYDLVRAGKPAALKARPVTVSKFQIVGEPRVAHLPSPAPTGEDALGEDAVGVVDVLDVDVVAEVSSGTYIRALARDLGEALGAGAHLTALRRTRGGRFPVDKCTKLEDLESLAERGEALPLLSLSESAKTLFPTLVVSSEAARRFAHGTAPSPGEVERIVPLAGEEERGGAVYAVAEQGFDSVLGLVAEERGGEARRTRFRTLNVFEAG